MERSLVLSMAEDVLGTAERSERIAFVDLVDAYGRDVQRSRWPVA